MKNFVIGLVVLFNLNLIGVASATPYSDVYDFSSTGTHLGQTYTELTDGNSTGYFGLYTHTVDFNPDADSVQSAELTLYYAYVDNHFIGNPAILKEIFLFYDNAEQLIGSLEGHGDDLWYSQTFDLSGYIAGITGSAWTIGFQFQETTLGSDKFYLDASRLFGEYTPITKVGTEPLGAPAPVPEPSTFLLLGCGLAGLAFLVRRRKKE